MQKKKPKLDNIHRALDHLRTGSTLLMMHTRSGPAWFLIPSGGEVAPSIVPKILAHQNIQPAHDALFPGITSQTFRFKSKTRIQNE